MDCSNLTKKQIIEGIENNTINYRNLLRGLSRNLPKNLSRKLKNDKNILIAAVKQDAFSLFDASEKFKDDKDVVLESVKKHRLSLIYASERLQNDKELLEILENPDSSSWHPTDKHWYYERMEVLANIRRQEDKDFMENSIIPNNKSAKKMKF